MQAFEVGAGSLAAVAYGPQLGAQPMSALARPGRVERAALDYYPTPGWVVETILPHLPRARCVLDPACGAGEILAAVAPARGLGIELDPLRAQEANNSMHVDSCVEGDALIVEWPVADGVVMNPPFIDVQAFIERALEWQERDPRRTVACLARLTILESEERRALHQAHPADVYVLSRRPKFRARRDGKMASDSVTCCWLVWGPGRGGRWSVL